MASEETPVTARGADPAAPRVGTGNRVARAIDGTLKVIVTSAVLYELAAVAGNVLSRQLFDSPVYWAQELTPLALTTIAFLGGAMAYRRGAHAFLHVFIDTLPLRYRRACYVLVELLVLTVAVTAEVGALTLFAARWNQLTPTLEVRVSWFVIPLIAGMVVFIVTAIERLLSQHRPTVFAVGAPFAALILLALLTHHTWSPWITADGALGLALILFFATVLIGVPVGFALFLGAFVYFYMTGKASIMVLAHTMVNGVGNFVLLAIPFFIFAGIIMNRGGISSRLVNFVHACVGHVRGGLYQVMVVSMYVVSGLSGSKSADVAAVGSVMRDMLRRKGYSLEKAAAVLASSAAMGETVPPSVAMLVIAWVTSLSVGALFIAGIIPAAVIAACLMTLIYVQSRLSHAPRAPRASLHHLAGAALGGVLPLLMLVMLFGGILLGIATPTEISAFAVVYGIVLACFVYRELGLRAFAQGVIDCASIAGMILFVLATASSFAWALTVAQLPQRLVGLLTGGEQSQWVFLLTSILLLVVAGAILDGLPALLILAPILMPIAVQAGVNKLHYALILVIAMGMGAFMPPVGIGFYITCAVCETTIEKSAREMVPFLIVLLLGLSLVALVPWFALVLPGKFHLG